MLRRQRARFVDVMQSLSLSFLLTHENLSKETSVSRIWNPTDRMLRIPLTRVSVSRTEPYGTSISITFDRIIFLINDSERMPKQEELELKLEILNFDGVDQNYLLRKRKR